MVIRSAIFNAAFWLCTFIIGFFGLPFSIISMRFAIGVARSWSYSVFWLLRTLCGISFEAHGREHIPAGPSLIVSKHQSAWDTVIFWLLLKRPVYVLKRELIFIPVFGWQLLLLKSIYIDRSAGASALKGMLKKAKKQAAEGANIVIFPEGTRIAPGQDSTYHPGVAALYQTLNIPTIPVALNSGYFWGKNAFFKKPGVITIEFLPIIPPGLKAREFMPRLKTQIEEACKRLPSR